MGWDKHFNVLFSQKNILKLQETRRYYDLTSNTLAY